MQIKDFEKTLQKSKLAATAFVFLSCVCCEEALFKKILEGIGLSTTEEVDSIS